MGEQLEDAVRVAVCELDHAANYWFARSGKSVAGARFADAAGRLRAAMGDAVSERDEARAELEALRGRVVALGDAAFDSPDGTATSSAIRALLEPGDPDAGGTK